MFLLKSGTGSRAHHVCQTRLLPVQIVVQYLNISILRFARVNLNFSLFSVWTVTRYFSSLYIIHTI